MTNKEAIKEIQRWLDGCPFADTKEAFNLAIKALEFDESQQLCCDNCVNHKALCDDCQEFPCDYSQEYPRYKCDFHVQRGV